MIRNTRGRDSDGLRDQTSFEEKEKPVFFFFGKKIVLCGGSLQMKHR